MTSQERSKERLYEEEIELKWEKGGSGLVFYTDAQYWQEEEGGMTGAPLALLKICPSDLIFLSCKIHNYTFPSSQIVIIVFSPPRF